MKKVRFKVTRFFKNKRMQAVLAVAAVAGMVNRVFAQDPGAIGEGLGEASDTLRSYVDPVSTIIMILGGIVGLVGAIRVFSKWQNGDQDVTKSLMAWLGSCIFLVLGGLIVKTVFGLN